MAEPLQSSYFLGNEVVISVGLSSSHYGPETESTEQTTDWTSHEYSQPSFNHLVFQNYEANRPSASRPGTSRTTRTRPRSAFSSLGIEAQEIICALSESRGITPAVGLAFLNLSTGEAVLSQISDTQSYTRTIHKLHIFNPSYVLMLPRTSTSQSALYSTIGDEIEDADEQIIFVERGYWSDKEGIEYIRRLAFADDAETILTAASGAYYAISAFAAVCKYLQMRMGQTFGMHCLRITYQPSEGAMMIDLSTIRSLELLQNSNNSRSKDCLFGLLNQTQTPMGSRLLKSTILQPLTDHETLLARYDALEELSTKESVFVGVRAGLKGFPDIERLLTQFSLLDEHKELRNTEQAINNVILLKEFTRRINPICDALVGCQSPMLETICSVCRSDDLGPFKTVINERINEDTLYAKQPLDLQNQRTYAAKSGHNGFLDVARQAYTEALTDALDHITELGTESGLQLQQKYDNTRLFYVRIRQEDLDGITLPPYFVNVSKKQRFVECQTLELMKRNQKIAAAHNEVLVMSDEVIHALMIEIRRFVPVLSKISEALAMLDMLSGFAQLVTTHHYVRPSIDDALAITGGRHPICEVIRKAKFIPNDMFATQQTRFQIVTGCNMSGKSTYIRAVALPNIMAQVGCFLPADFAVVPIVKQLFARVSFDDDLETNMSTFAAEMREMAFILRNIDTDSLVIIDELGRGTSSRDGLAIALAISEALIQSRALVWFATHFRELAYILSERNGVVSMHLSVDMSAPDALRMLYRVAPGAEQESNYCLRLARSLVSLPENVLQHAESVSSTLRQRSHARKCVGESLAIIRARRRKLLLNLREHLHQARSSEMDDANLSQWLQDLQKQFVEQMLVLEDQEKVTQTQLKMSEDQNTSS